MIFKIGVYKIFTIFSGKHLCSNLFSIKLLVWRHAILLKGDSNTGFFPEDIAKLLRTPLLQNTSSGCFCKCSETFSFLINRKFLKKTYQNNQIWKMTAKNTRWYVAMTSQRCQSHLGTSWSISKTCLVGQSHLGTSWYVATTSQIDRFYLRRVLFYIAKTSQIGPFYWYTSWDVVMIS